MKRHTNLLILLAVAALAIAPLAMGAGDRKEEPFTGSDSQAETAITENEPDYKPWFSPLYEPPSGEIESALFALQAAIGAGVIGYYFGVVRTRRKLAAEQATEKATEQAAEQTTEQGTEQAAEKATGQATEQATGQTTGQAAAPGDG